VNNITFSLPASQFNLFLVELNVTFLKFPHFLDFIQVDDKTLVHVVKLANALTTKDRRMLRTVEVFDSLIMGLAQVYLDLFVLT
jgi:hypothetical protein